MVCILLLNHNVVFSVSLNQNGLQRQIGADLLVLIQERFLVPQLKNIYRVQNPDIPRAGFEGGVGRRRRWERDSSFFGQRRGKMGGSSFFEPGRSKNHPPHLRRTSPIFEVPPPFFVFRSIFDPFFGAEDRRWRGPSISGTEDRRMKMGSSSIFGAEDWVEDRRQARGGRRVGSPRRQSSLSPSIRSKKPSWARLWKREQRKPYVNRMEEMEEQS